MVRRATVRGGVFFLFLAAASAAGCDPRAHEIAAREQALTAPAWSPGTSYAPGEQVSYEGQVYQALQAHTAQEGWQPPHVPALWSHLGSDTGSSEGDPDPLPSDYFTLKARCDEFPRSCCASGATPFELTSGDDTATITSGSGSCVLAGAGNDTLALHAEESGSIVLGPGNDVVFDSQGSDLVIWGGAGSDTIHSLGGVKWLFGNEGADVISSSVGSSWVVPGPGADTVALGPEADRVYIFDVCEVEAGETLDGGAGEDTLILPVPLAELTALGLQVSNFEHVVVEPNSCRSECSDKPPCVHGTCVEGSTPGEMRCECAEGWYGPSCDWAPEGRTRPNPNLPRAPQARRLDVSGRNSMGPGYFALAGIPGIPSEEVFQSFVLAGLVTRPSIPDGYTSKATTGLTLHLETTLPGDGWPEGNDLRIQSQVGSDARGEQPVGVEDGDPRDSNVYAHRAMVQKGSIVQVSFQEVEYNLFSDHESVKAELSVDLTTGAITGFIESAVIEKTWAWPLPYPIDSYQVLRRETVDGQLGVAQTFAFHGDNDVTWRLDLDPGVTGEVRVCGNWNAYFVEDQIPGASTSTTHPYPASFARFDLRTRGVGGTFGGTGYLDADGCVPELVPADALAYAEGDEEAVVWLQLATHFLLPEGAGGGSVPLTRTGNNDFITAAVQLNRFSNHSDGGAPWTNQGGLLVPPATLALAPTGEEDATAEAAVISASLRRVVAEGVSFSPRLPVRMFSTISSGPLDYSCRLVPDSAFDPDWSGGGALVVGAGHVPRADDFDCACTSDSACGKDANGQDYPCVNGNCQLPVDDFRHARACSTSENSCPATQFCASRAHFDRTRTPDACAPGEENCVCSHRSQAVWKFVGAHEFGHGLQNYLVGSNIPGTDYGYRCLPGSPCAEQGTPVELANQYGISGIGLEDPPHMDPLCGCHHVETANGSHCLQSMEAASAAQGEGFAQYFASLVWNGPGRTDCTFHYYKEYRLASGAVLLPPMPIDCWSPVAWRNRTSCVVHEQATTYRYGSQMEKPIMGTEHDWMTFLYSLSGNGIGLGDVLSIYRWAVDIPPLSEDQNENGIKDSYEDGSELPVEPPVTSLPGDHGIFWLDDRSQNRRGFLDGVKRKWGEGPLYDAVLTAGREHGVSNEVP